LDRSQEARRLKKKDICFEQGKNELLSFTRYRQFVQNLMKMKSTEIFRTTQIEVRQKLNCGAVVLKMSAIECSGLA